MSNLYNSASNRFRSCVFRLVKVEQEEIRPLLWSFSSLFDWRIFGS